MRKVTEKMLSDLDYFIAGLPPCPLFRLMYNDLHDLVLSAKADNFKQESTAEICLIALVAYFEAFFKSEFAAIMNICPQVLESFCSKRPDASVAVSDLMAIDFDSENRIGFVLAEKYDFGSAKKINSLFFDLLGIDLFSTYDKLLNDRNLLVHHGGIYTIKYQDHSFKRKRISNKIFFDSLVVKRKDYLKWARFVDQIVQKTISVCYKATQDSIKRGRFKLSKGQRKALKYLDWYE